MEVRGKSLGLPLNRTKKKQAKDSLGPVKLWPTLSRGKRTDKQ